MDKLNVLCPHCQCITDGNHVLICSQRDNDTDPHPTTPPPTTPTVDGSLWVWQVPTSWNSNQGWVLWGAVDRTAWRDLHYGVPDIKVN